MKKIIIAVVIVVVLVGAGLGIYFTGEASATQKVNENQTSKKVENQTPKQADNQKPKEVENPVKPTEEKIDYNNISYKQVNFNGISIQCPTFLSKESNGNNSMTLASADNSVVLNLNQVPNENGIENYFNQAVSNTSNIGYKYVNSKTFSLSWEDGANEIYESGIVNGNSIMIFKITSPEKDKDKMGSVTTKIYKSFIANMSNNQSTTVTPSNKQNQQLTFNDASNYLYKYLVDTNQWIQATTRYKPILVNNSMGGDNSSVSALVASNFANNVETKKCMNEINENAPIYDIWYQESVQDSPTSGHISRIGSYYVVKNGIYYQTLDSGLEKVADIDNGNLSNVIKPPAGV